jgi:hypothetical protein
VSCVHTPLLFLVFNIFQSRLLYHIVCQYMLTDSASKCTHTHIHTRAQIPGVSLRHKRLPQRPLPMLPRLQGVRPRPVPPVSSTLKFKFNFNYRYRSASGYTFGIHTVPVLPRLQRVRPRPVPPASSTTNFKLKVGFKCRPTCRMSSDRRRSSDQS